MQGRSEEAGAAAFEARVFELGSELTAEQLDYFARWGFLHFRGFATAAEVDVLRAEMRKVQDIWIGERRLKINGIPVKWGEDTDGSTMVQRFAFTSVFSEPFSEFVNDPRFDPVKRLIGEDCRVGESEKDGVVVNHYVNVEGSAYKELGWHTDGLRDVFYGRKPGPMLNVGVYLDDSPRAKGGLRLIPGSHEQSLWKMAFGKLHFIDKRPDRREICVEASAGDLTIHDGRLWHRVARAEATGEASRRRIMYVPFLNGPYEPKDESSKTPFYHHFQRITGGKKDPFGDRAAAASRPRIDGPL